ncbi:MAG: hypothetical protein M1831_004104 [Alyxoria varia]|nr:MAG: hypothetical protein M1831_004104 [Alyxoria varia]
MNAMFKILFGGRGQEPLFKTDVYPQASVNNSGGDTGPKCAKDRGLKRDGTEITSESRGFEDTMKCGKTPPGGETFPSQDPGDDMRNRDSTSAAPDDKNSEAPHQTSGKLPAVLPGSEDHHRATTIPLGECDLDKLPRKHQHGDDKTPHRFPTEYDNCVIEVPSGNGNNDMLAIPITDKLHKKLKHCLDFEPDQQLCAFRLNKIYERYADVRERIDRRQDTLTERYKELEEQTKTLPEERFFREMHAIERQRVELDRAADDLNEQKNQETSDFREGDKERDTRRTGLVVHLYNMLMGSALVRQYKSDPEAVQIDHLPFDLKILDEGRTRALMRSGDADDDLPAYSSSSHVQSSKIKQPPPDYSAYEAMCKVNKARHNLECTTQRRRQFEDYEFAQLEWLWRLQRDSHGRDNVESWQQFEQRRRKRGAHYELEYKARVKDLQLAVSHGRRWGLRLDEDGIPNIFDAPLHNGSESAGESADYDRRRRRRWEEEEEEREEKDSRMYDEIDDQSSPRASHYFDRNPPPPPRSRDRGHRKVERWAEHVSAAQPWQNDQDYHNPPVSSGGGSSTKRKREASNRGEEEEEEEEKEGGSKRKRRSDEQQQQQKHQHKGKGGDSRAGTARKETRRGLRATVSAGSERDSLVVEEELRRTDLRRLHTDSSLVPIGCRKSDVGARS